MAMSYDDAVTCLNSRRTRPKQMLDEMRGIDDMEPWLKEIGCPPQSLASLRIIHIAGTNGKGQTCALVAAILNSYSNQHNFQWRVGLYTSPHLRDVKERIQINGKAVSEEVFSSSFSEIWGKLPSEPTVHLDTPKYLQLLFIIAIHIFCKCNVDVAVIETHCGGKYDATNVIPNPVVVGISSISFDHTHLLGESLQEIAAHKAGIFKRGCIPVTGPQHAEVLRELERRACELEIELEFAPAIDVDVQLNLMIPPAVYQNLTLAAMVCSRWITAILGEAAAPLSPTLIESGYRACRWPGRFDTIEDGHITWLVDGGHNVDGVRQAASWFISKTKEVQSFRPIIIFGHKSQRDTTQLLDALLVCLGSLEHQGVHFVLTTYKERKDDNSVSIPESLLQQQRDYIRRCRPGSPIWIEHTIEEAIKRARMVADGCAQILVVGSLKLVSGALGFLRPDGNAAFETE